MKQKYLDIFIIADHTNIISGEAHQRMMCIMRFYLPKIECRPQNSPSGLPPRSKIGNRATFSPMRNKLIGIKNRKAKGGGQLVSPQRWNLTVNQVGGGLWVSQVLRKGFRIKLKLQGRMEPSLQIWFRLDRWLKRTNMQTDTWTDEQRNGQSDGCLFQPENMQICKEMKSFISLLFLNTMQMEKFVLKCNVFSYCEHKTACGLLQYACCVYASVGKMMRQRWCGVMVWEAALSPRRGSKFPRFVDSFWR